MDRFGLGQNLNSRLVTHTGMGIWATGESIPCTTLEPVTDGATVDLALDSIIGLLPYENYYRGINPLRPEGRARATMLFRLGELIGIIIGFSNNGSKYAGYLPTKCIAPDGTNFGFMKPPLSAGSSYLITQSSDFFGLKQEYFASNVAPCDERHRASGRLAVGQVARAATRLKNLLERLPSDERGSFLSQVFERYFGYPALLVRDQYNDYLKGTYFPYDGFPKYAAFTNAEADYLEGRSDTLPARPVYTSVKPGGYGGVIVGVNNGGTDTTGGGGTDSGTIVGNVPDLPPDPAYTPPADEQTTTSNEQPTKKSFGILPLLALGVAAYFATKE